MSHQYREKLGGVVIPYEYRASYTAKRCLIVSWLILCAGGGLKEDEWRDVKLMLKDNARIVCPHTRVRDTIGSCKDAKAYENGKRIGRGTIVLVLIA